MTIEVGVRRSKIPCTASCWEHTIAPPSSGVSTPDDKCEPRQIMPRWDVHLYALQLDCVAANLERFATCDQHGAIADKTCRSMNGMCPATSS